MARAKKQLENNFPDESDLATDNHVEIVTNEFANHDLDEPVAEETHRVVRTWKKKVPVESNGNVDVIEVEAEPARPLDPIEELLKEIGVSPQQWTMTVHRLMNYERDGNCSPSARKALCGTLPFDANYAETIQAKFARPNKPNDFLVAVRCGNRIHSYLPVVQVEYVLADATDDATQANHAFPATVERDPFAEVEKALRMIKRMNDALGVSQTIPPPAPPPEPKITTELALLHLAKEDPEMLARQRDRIFGRDNPDAEPESIWAPIVKELLPTVPVIAQAVLLWLGGHANPAQLLPQVPNAPPAPPEPPQMPSPPPPAQTATMFVLEQIITACAQNVPPKDVAAFLEQMEAKAPDVGTFLNFIVEMEPKQVLEFIRSFVPQAAPVTQLIHAENWIALLQKQMSAEDAAPEGSPHE